MKLLNLRFKNITTLKGEWEIAFDRPPLADADLFAIVGPNGAGKTSILDALTLALYGETSRLRDPNGEIMSRLTTDSYAMVTFSVGGEVYQSRWSIQKSEGKCGPPEMVLSTLNGGAKPLVDGTIRVQTQIAELTGLDFKRFCRSVLLPQGEFAAFLNALESERAEILERIIGAELGQEQETSVRMAVEVENEKLRQLKETAAKIHLMDEACLKDLQESIERTKKDLLDADRLMDTLKASKDRQLRVLDLKSAEKSAAEELAAAEARHAESRAEYEFSEKARPFLSEFSDFQRLSAASDQARGEMDRLKADFNSHREAAEELEELLRRTGSELEKNRREFEGRGETFRKAGDLARDITQQQEQFRDAVSRFEGLELEQKENLKGQSEISGQIAETTGKHKETQQWLAGHSADAGLESAIPVVEEMVNRLMDVRRQIVDGETRLAHALKSEQRTARELKQITKAAEKTGKKADKLDAKKSRRDLRIKELLGEHSSDSLTVSMQEKRLRLAFCSQLFKIAEKYRKAAGDEETLVSLEQIQSERDSLALSLASEQDILARLEKRREELKKFVTGRLALEPDIPCPFCGSKDHPFVIETPDTETIEAELKTQRDKVDELKRQFAVLSAKAGKLKAVTESLEKMKRKWMKDSGKLEPERGLLQASGLDGCSVANSNLLQEEIRTLESEIKQQRSRLRSIRWHSWISNWWGRALHKTREKLSEKERQKVALEREHDLRRNESASFEREMEELRNTERDTKEVIAEKLAECGVHPPKSGKELDLILHLKDRNDAYLQRMREKNFLGELMESLQERKAALPGRIEDLKERAAAQASEVERIQRRLSELEKERETIFGGTDLLLEKRELQDRIAALDEERLSITGKIERFRESLRQEEAELQLLDAKASEAEEAALMAESKLTGKVAANGFASLDEIGENILLLENIESIEKRFLDADLRLEEAKARRQAASDALASAILEESTGDPPEVVQSRIAEIAERRDMAMSELESAEETLKKQDELERERRQVLQDIIEQQDLCEKLTAERDALRSNPAEAKSSLQRLMLERLIERSNRYLELFGGRYHLRDRAKEGLGLQVEDSTQKMCCRPVKTLSGGESFMVSLGLALGLSDLASRDRKIETLFIDEGFGSLDSEALGSVIASLKKLQATGKMVGIVSHIQRLAAAIPVRIKLETESEGVTRISIVP